jgi:hypothetical protein
MMNAVYVVAQVLTEMMVIVIVKDIVKIVMVSVVEILVLMNVESVMDQEYMILSVTVTIMYQIAMESVVVILK